MIRDPITQGDSPRGWRLVFAATTPETLVKFVVPQLSALRSAGFDVLFVSGPGTWGPAGPPTEVTVHTVRLRREMSLVSDFTATASLVRLFRRLRPDILVASSPKAGVIATVAGRVAGTPVRILQHRGARWETERGLLRNALILGDRVAAACATDVLAVSHSLATALLDQGIVSQPPVVLGAGGSKGVHTEIFTPVGDEARQAGPPRVGYLGRLSKDKGIEHLLTAFDLILETRPDARLSIAGYLDEADPPTAESIARIRSDTRILWAGATQDPVSFLRPLDVLIFPSAREGLPNAVIEAAACGIPTVAWRVTGVIDAVNDGVTGALVAYGDVRSLASQALKLVDRTGPRLRSDCRDWARRFDQAETTDRFLQYVSEAARAIPLDTERRTQAGRRRFAAGSRFQQPSVTDQDG